MKFTVLVVTMLLLLTQNASSSIYDEVENWVNSVKFTFSDLLSDEIVDVRETVDCTIFAVEQLIVTNENLSQRCQDQNTYFDDTTSTPVKDDSENISLPDRQAEENIKKDSIGPIIHKQIAESVIKLNSTVGAQIKSEEVYTQLETVQASLKGESQRLIEINTYLQHKLVTMSSEVKNKFNKTAIVGNGTLLKDIWSNLQILNKAQRSDVQKDVKVNEIEKAMDKILTILRNNDSQSALVNDEIQINNIIIKLADHVSAGIQSRINSNTYTKSVEALKQNFVKNKETNIKSETSTLHPLTASIDNKDNKVVVSNNKDQVTIIEPVKPKENTDSLLDFYEDYYNSNDPIIQPVARSEEARDIINNYKYSQDLINKYFDNPKYVDEETINENGEANKNSDYDNLFSKLYDFGQ